MLHGQNKDQSHKHLEIEDSDSERDIFEDHLRASKDLKVEFEHKDDIARYEKIEKVIVIFLIVLFTLALIKSFFYKQKQAVKIEEFNKYLHIKTLQGEIKKLPYLNSDVYHPQKVPEQPFGLLSVPDTTEFEKYVQNLGNPVEFSSKLFLNWGQSNEKLFQAEYYKYNAKYGLDDQVVQKPICIMAPFRNLLKYGIGGSFNAFLKSVNAQNYSNYRVYMIDDFSSDNSTDVLLKQVINYPRLNNRIWIFKNNQAIGALGNRDSTTRNYCQSGDIVMDIDGDDALIGKQVFNVYNRIYHKNDKVWFLYTNFLAVKGSSEGDGRDIKVDMSKARTGKCATINLTIHQKNTYRTDLDLWVTSQLRTYLWDLYMRIPIDYILERGTGRYYIEASDRFIMYALAELAGPNHTFYYQQYVYFYYEPNFRALQTFDCVIPILFFCEVQARVLTPLQPLKSLQQPKAEVDPSYQIPKHILDTYIKRELKLNECNEKLNPILKKIFESQH